MKTWHTLIQICCEFTWENIVSKWKGPQRIVLLRMILTVIFCRDTSTVVPLCFVHSTCCSIGFILFSFFSNYLSFSHSKVPSASCHSWFINVTATHNVPITAPAQMNRQVKRMQAIKGYHYLNAKRIQSVFSETHRDLSDFQRRFGMSLKK
jgi:hypothetical protein